MKYLASLTVLLVLGAFPCLIAQTTPPQAATSLTSAVGDGRADDTAAIQGAVAAGGAVRFPRGVFRLTKTVLIHLESTGFISLAGDGVARFVMEGAGPAFKFIGTHEGICVKFNHLNHL